MKIKIKITLLALIVSIFSYGQCKSGDCENGRGLYQFEDGAYFKGIFKNGKVFQGKYHFKNGDIFEGTFLNQKLNGPNCKIITSDQTRSGTFKNGNLTSGVFIQLNEESTDRYEGNFNENSKLTGEGTFTRTSNKEGKYIRKGKFINGVLNDKNGYILFFDKRYYKGEVKDNYPNGNGKMTFPNDNFQEGIFLDGIFQRAIDSQKKIDNGTKVLPLMFNENHGVYYININVSGTNFETVFDTGAAFLVLDQGYLYSALKAGEILQNGTVITIDANNNEVEKDKFILKKLKIGDIELENIEAIANDLGGPSLFGVGLLKLIGTKFILDFENNQINIIN